MDADWLITHDGSSIASTTDADGNVYVLGTLLGTLVVGSSTLTSTEQVAAYVGKYDNSGHGVWGIIIGYFLAGFSISGNGDMAVDENGNVFGVFSYSGAIMRYVVPPLFGQDATQNTVGIFRIQADPDPKVIYIQTLIHDRSQYFRTDTDGEGNLFIGGTFTNVLTTARATMTAPHENDIVLIGLAPDGSYLWQTSGIVEETCNTDCPVKYNAITTYGMTYAQGRIFITGNYFGTVRIDNVVTTTVKLAGQEYLSALNATSGDFVFFCDVNYTPDDTLSSRGTSLASTETDIYQTALVQLNDAKNIAGVILAVRKFDLDGMLQWEKYVDAVEYDSYQPVLLEIATTEAGESYIYGSFSEDITFGAFMLSSNNVLDHYVASIDDSGNWTGALLVEGKIKNYGKDVAARMAGECFINGTHDGQLIIGSKNATSVVEQLFIAKII